MANTLLTAEAVWLDSTRVATFEGALHNQDVSALSKLRAQQVKRASLSLIKHVNSLLPTACSCWSAVFYFKINPDQNLVIWVNV